VICALTNVRFIVGTAAIALVLLNACPDSAEARQRQAVKTSPNSLTSQRLTKKARADLLARLYGQLKVAPDGQSAVLIAKTIERVWRRSGSDTADLLLERAIFAIQTQDFDLALKLLSALTTMAPNYAEGWNQLATVHFMREDYGNAVHELRRVLALEPHHFKAIEGLAVILRETGHKKAALKAVRHVLSIYPHLKSAKQAEEELAREVEGQEL
jgi:Flp pilus assembly protein TadD